MLMYICLPRLFYLGLRSGRLTGNFGQSPQSWVCVTVDKEDNKAPHLTAKAALQFKVSAPHYGTSKT